MSTLGPVADASGHHDIHPSLRQIPLDPAPSLYLSSPAHYPFFDGSDLTSYLQYCGFHGLTATMALGQNGLDMENFQRLSDNYQPDVQVCSSTLGIYILDYTNVIRGRLSVINFQFRL
jgi:hypothetical protein